MKANEGLGGNAVVVQIGCNQCPKNSLTMLSRAELNEAEEQVGKVRVCPKCGTNWSLDELEIRARLVPDRPTVIVAIPVWTPKWSRTTPALMLNAVRDDFGSYDADSVAAGVEQMVKELVGNKTGIRPKTKSRKKN